MFSYHIPHKRLNDASLKRSGSHDSLASIGCECQSGVDYSTWVTSIEVQRGTSMNSKVRRDLASKTLTRSEKVRHDRSSKMEGFSSERSNVPCTTDRSGSSPVMESDISCRTLQNNVSRQPLQEQEQHTHDDTFLPTRHGPHF